MLRTDQPLARRIIHKLPKVLLAAFGISQVVGVAYADNPGLPFDVASDLSSDGCETIPRQKIDAFEAKMTALPSKEAMEVATSTIGTRYDNTYRNLVMRKAKKYGLTIIDDRPFRAKVDRAQSVGEVISTVNEFLAPRNITISVYEHHDITDRAGLFHALDPSKLDLKKFKQGANQFMDAYFSIPVEVTNLTDIKEVKITGGAIGHYASGDAFPYSTTMHIDLDWWNFGASKDVYRHEQSHFITYAVCNGVWGVLHDKQARSFNPKGFSYGKFTDSSAFADNYGGMTPLEDSATVMEGTAGGLDDDLFYPEKWGGASDALRDKAATWTLRIAGKVPGYDGYLLETATRRPPIEVVTALMNAMTFG